MKELVKAQTIDRNIHFAFNQKRDISPHCYSTFTSTVTMFSTNHVIEMCDLKLTYKRVHERVSRALNSLLQGKPSSTSVPFPVSER